MEERIGSQVESRQVVTPQNQWIKRQGTKIMEEILDPHEFNDGVTDH